MESPSYYAVIPASVRYDERLKANEKLLYGELTALSRKDGFAFASNGYFAKLYGVSKETVSDVYKRQGQHNAGDDFILQNFRGNARLRQMRKRLHQRRVYRRLLQKVAP